MKVPTGIFDCIFSSWLTITILIVVVLILGLIIFSLLVLLHNDTKPEDFE